MKTVVITGATSGIGFAVCRELAATGYSIIGVGRSEENCQKALALLKQSNPDASIKFFCADLMQQAAVVQVASDIKDYIINCCGGRLYALINNAGCVKSWYTTTQDGYEQQFALNHLAPFLLTYSLLPYLRDGGRVLITSSNSHKMMRIHWKDVMFRRGYNPLLAYKQSKLCNMLFAYGLNDRYAHMGIHAYGIDPGLVATDIGLKETGSLVRLIWKLRKNSGVQPDVPAKTYKWILDQEVAPDGLYYYLCKKTEHSSQVTKENADRLWALSEQLCGIT